MSEEKHGEKCNSGCPGDCKICKSDFGPCSLTRSGKIFKRDDDTDDTRTNGDPEPTIKANACPLCHSDMHKSNPLHRSEWYCVLCGYEEDENGGELL